MLKACKEAGVKELRLEGLHVIFEGIDIKPGTTNLRPPFRNSRIANEKAEELAKENFERQEYETKEDRLVRMALEDPSQLEDLLASGDLEDVGEKAQEH